jgi:hypothetical protein
MRWSRLTFLWGLMSCSLARTHQYFRGIACLHPGQYCGVLEVYQMFCLQGHHSTGKNGRLYRLLSEGGHWDMAAPQITLTKMWDSPPTPFMVPSHRHDKRDQRREKTWGKTNGKQSELWWLNVWLSSAPHAYHTGGVHHWLTWCVVWILICRSSQQLTLCINTACKRDTDHINHRWWRQTASETLVSV